jgi:hypothetical protein
MTFQSALPVAESQLGIALETTRGTPVAPDYWLPVMAPKYAPDIKYLPDQTLQGSMVDIYDQIPSLRMDTHGWDSYPYLDTLPVYIRACLGSEDHLTAAGGSTTLSAPATAGATTITTAGDLVAGSYYVIDQGTVGLQETVKVLSIVTTTATLEFPLVFAHASSAAVAGLVSHTFSLLNNSNATGNQPPSCTLTDYAGETNWRQLAGAQLDGFNMSGSADALPKLTVNWMAYLATTPEAPSASYSEAEAPPGWTATLSFNGVQVAGGGVGGATTGMLMDWAWDLKRNVKPIPAITGTQNYFQFFAGPLTASGKVTVIDDPSATWLTAYEDGDTETIDFTLTDVKSGYAVNYHSTRSKFITGSLDRSSNDEWVKVPLDLTLIPSATDALDGGVSPVVITVANSQTASY